jgi:hypothetical protein
LGIWKTNIPTNQPVWFEDASSSSKFVSMLLGKPVKDMTPAGLLIQKTPPIQYVSTLKDNGKPKKLDIKMSTSDKELRESGSNPYK